MNNALLALLGLLMIFTLWHWLWKLAQHLWQPNPNWPLPIWQPRHPQVIFIAGFVGILGILIIFQPNDLLLGQLWQALKDLAPEMVGLAFIVVVIDELTQLRIEQQEKLRIFRQLKSPVTDAAVEAVRLVRENGWLDEVVKNMDLQNVWWTNADLREANLEGAKLFQAKLEGADLREATLKGANLRRANLKRADLRYATLKGASLRQANLEGANLTVAKLERVDLTNAGVVHFSWIDRFTLLETERTFIFSDFAGSQRENGLI